MREATGRQDGPKKRWWKRHSFEKGTMPLSVVAVLLLVGVAAVCISKQLKTSESVSISKATRSSTTSFTSTAQTTAAFNANSAERNETRRGLAMISGVWEFQAGCQNTPESMALQQIGTSLVGQGRNASGAFVVEGRLVPPNKIELTKRFDHESRKRGAHALPILLSGQVVEEPTGTLQATGLYRTQVKSGFKQGYLNQSRWATVTGNWTARRLSDLPGTFSSQKIYAAVNRTHQAELAWNPLRLLDSQPKMERPSSDPWWSWLSVAPLYLVPLALGGAGFFIATKVFGPGGLTSTLETARIVPTQYASEHNKRKREFGKRLEPSGVPIGVHVSRPGWAFWSPRE
jgi:hypothetical protein